MQSAMFDQSGAPTLEAARAAGQLGMSLALDKAESDSPNWSNIALEFARRYAQTHIEFPWYFVTMEAENDASFPAPANDKAWGGITQRAIKAGIIEDSGRTMKHPRRHAVKATVWRSLVFRGVG